MMRTLFTLLVGCLAMGAGAATPAIEPQANAFESPGLALPQTDIDKLVMARLRPLGVEPVLCSDAVFVRRVYLDLTGTLPTAKEARDFIQDEDAKNKRRQLIDRLLASEAFADYWAMEWGDLLRIKAEFPVNLWPNAAQAYHRWVHAALTENKPYDKFARELLTSSGSNFRVPPVNFYRAIQNRTPEGTARAVALTFMGARAEAWPTNRLAGMVPFFSQVGYKPTSEWKEEHVFWDPLGASAIPGNTAPGRPAIVSTNTAVQVPASMPTNTPPSEAVFPDGTRAKLSADRDPREVFADWLITPKNPWFTRCIVNRVWAWLLGRGIIHEPDDIRDDNPPTNPALLAYLEKEMVTGRYDLKRLYRLILNSRTYQSSSMARVGTPEAEANFAAYSVRRLEAEVLIDAINKVTGSSDLYTSPIPEPFTYIPRGMPAVTIADGSITSPFLALFGRSARATGMANERNHKPTPAQWLYLLNSTDIQRKLEQGTNMQAILSFGRRKPPQILEELYLTILSRLPTGAEVEVAEGYGRAQGTGRTGSAAKASAASSNTNKPAATNSSAAVATASNAAGTNASRPGPASSLSQSKGAKPPVKTRDDWVDIAWSLINSEEFLYRH